MNLNALTDNEVKILINELKNCQKALPNDTPLIGRIKDDTPTVDFTNHIEYYLHRYRNPIDPQRFSLHIRFKATEDHLIRFDINNGTHKNPDMSIVQQNHMHVYHSNGDLAKDAVAISLPADIDINSIFTALESFLEYTNTKEYKS